MGQTEGLDLLQDHGQHRLVSLAQVTHKVLHAQLGLGLNDQSERTLSGRCGWERMYICWGWRVSLIIDNCLQYEIGKF